jgi:hypothetical protein
MRNINPFGTKNDSSEEVSAQGMRRAYTLNSESKSLMAINKVAPIGQAGQTIR